MIDVVNKRCFCGKSQPSFAFPEDKASRCASCRLDGMIDVVNHQCFCGNAKPSMALPGHKASHCASCRTEGMINVISKRCFCGQVQPCFALPGNTASHCAQCKLADMIYVTRRMEPCSSCHLQHLHDQLKTGLCCQCRQQVPRIELKVRDFLLSEFPNCNWVFDKTIAGILACSDKRYRPDCWLELDSHVVVVECDERQHKNYEDSCELRRLLELVAACQGKPLTMIRWNPDEYEVNGKQRKTQLKQRLSTLRDGVRMAMKESPNVFLDVRYMFYDDTRQEKLQRALFESMAAYAAAGR